MTERNKKSGPPVRTITRRGFVSTAAASIGALAASGFPAPAAAQKGKGPVTRNPLHIPPTVSPSNYSLTAAPGTVDLGGGKTSSAWLYNGILPGPTFRANSGDSASIQFANGLVHESTIHWHGMLVPGGAADGHPLYLIGPQESYQYQFNISQRACLNWYHPHPHMMTGEQVCLGLAGAFILNDAEEASLNLPPREIPLVIRDANFDRAGNLIYNPKSSGFLGSVPLVNGTREPRLDVATDIYRFRVLNGANARLFRLVLSNGQSITLIGNDGGLLPSAVQISEFEFSPGERLDIVVDFRNLPVGTRVTLRDLNAGWDILEFNVTQAVTSSTSLPAGALSSITPLGSPVRTRTFSFDGMSRINGREYDLNRIDFQVPFGQVERWTFTTKGNAPHPVHVHGASFQVQSRTGGRAALFPWESGWKDTVLLQDGETVDVLIRFDAYRGLYLLHCHKLEHEDMGMMSNFTVI